MSLDDMIQGDDVPPPTVCDKCAEMLETTPPTVAGWPLLVFACAACTLEFCEHLESTSKQVCVSCFPKSNQEGA